MKFCCPEAPRIVLPGRSCTNCGRRLCAWHRAESPIQIEGEPVVRLIPVCHPQCDSLAWDAPQSGPA